MAIDYSTPLWVPARAPLVPIVPLVEPTNIDLLRRYCPILAVHSHAQLAAHVHPDERGCWPWDGSLTTQGYGNIWFAPTAYGYHERIHTHRYMYDTLVGPIPQNYYVHHRCEYKRCWHPLHLEAVTPKEHSARHRQRPC